MRLTIRTRLTLWYVTLLTVSILTFAVVFFYALSKDFNDQIDLQLEKVSAMMTHTIVQPPGVVRIPRNFDILLQRFFGVRTSGVYIQVVDPGGSVRGKSSNLEDFEIPLSDETYWRVLNGDTVYEVVTGMGRYPVRIVTRPVVLKDFGFISIIQVGSSLEGRERIFHRMASLFSVGAVILVLIAAVVGRFLAMRALKPVDFITKLARKMGAENLDERIDISGPEDEITRLAGTFNEMLVRLERSFKQVRQFTGDASHELKTPLTVMKGEMEVALRAEISCEELEETIKSSLEEVDRMSFIVANLLELARSDVEVVKTDVSLDRVVSERFEHFGKLAGAKDVSISILKNERVVVTGDGVRLSQLVYNLIDNAIKYTPRGGSVEVSLERAGGKAILKVRDTGVGIPSEDVPYIFDRFYRVDKARSRTGGATEAGGEVKVGGVGLGLSICKDIIDSHWGTIEVMSDGKSGTTFIVKLPEKLDM